MTLRNIIKLCLIFLILSSCAKVKIAPKRFCTVSFQFTTCTCRMFDPNTWEALENSMEYPLGYCEGISGFYTEDWAVELLPKLRYRARAESN